MVFIKAAKPTTMKVKLTEYFTAKQETFRI